MSHGGEICFHHGNMGPHPIATVIRHAVGMFTPGGAMTRLAVGTACTERWMIGRADGMSNPAGVKTHLDVGKTPLGAGPSPPDTRMIDTATHAEFWPKD